MAIFGILLQDPDSRVIEHLRQQYGSSQLYELSETIILLRTDQLAEDVAIAAKIKGEERFAAGVVFKLNRAYAGYASRSLWEWLRLAEEE